MTELGPGTEVALITFTDRTNLVGYRATNPLPFPILIDADRSAYRALGLGRGSIGRVYGLQAARRYLEIIRSGGLTGGGGLAKAAGVLRPTEDPLQLGGDFVIDAEGTLAYGFWGRGPDDRPSVDELVEAVAALGSG